MTTAATNLERPSPRKHPSRSTIAEVVTSLRESLGEALTAHIADVQDLATIDEWVAGRAKPASDVAHRLRTALGIVQILLEVETPAIVRARFGGRNRMLGDRSPGAVIRSDPEAVLGAARAFRADG